MRRRHWIEIHEQPWFPASLRNLTTDGLQFVWNFLGVYKPVVPLLRHALQQIGTRRVLDLCSGGGGPWLSLVREFKEKAHFAIEVRLTDKYPNPDAVQDTQLPKESSVVAYAEPVDAVGVPAELEGFRTIFTAFHHFRPADARGILEDAVRNGQGVGVFEVPKRSWRTILLVVFVPIVAFVLAPLIWPFRWSRLLWTYLIPVVPFVLWFDGVVSCLRAYTSSELLALAQGIPHHGYRWEAGEARSGRLPMTVTYLIGYPLGGQASHAPAGNNEAVIAASE